jgi:hypothetical protein
LGGSEAATMPTSDTESVSESDEERAADRRRESNSATERERHTERPYCVCELVKCFISLIRMAGMGVGN